MSSDRPAISFGWLIVVFIVAFIMTLRTWDAHEARHNRIECAKFNADAQNFNMTYPERPPVTLDLDACHPWIP